MHKKWIWILISLILVTFICGCGQSDHTDHDAAVTFSVEEKAAAWMNEAVFEDTMNLMTPGVMDTTVGLVGKYESSASYAACSGATAEMLIVLQCSDPEAAKAAKAVLEAFRDRQRSDFSTYNPNEVPKLDNALIEARGRYAIYCVAKDAAPVKRGFDACFTASGN